MEKYLRRSPIQSSRPDEAGAAMTGVRAAELNVLDPKFEAILL